MKISYLMIKSVDLKFSQDQFSGCRCSIAFFFKFNSIQFNMYCHLNHKTDLSQNKDKNILQIRKKKIKNNTCTMYYGFPVLSSRDCLIKAPIVPTCTGDDGQRIYIIVSPSPILDLS